MVVPVDGFSRRDFFSTGTLLLGSALLSACESSPLAPLLQDPRRTVNGNSLYLFADEAGQFRGDLAQPRYFVLGLLMTGHADTHRAAIASRRAAYGYVRVLRYSSTDKEKLGLSRALIDYFFNEAEDLRFAATVFDPSVAAGAPAYEEVYARAIQDAAGDADSLHLLAERRSSGFTPFTAFRDALTAAITGLRVDRIHAAEDDLAQLADLFTGSIFGDRAGPRLSMGRRNAVKEEIIDALKDALGVKDLAHPSLAGRSDFSVQVVRPPF